MVVEGTSHLSQPSEATADVVAVNWDEIDAEFSSIIRPVHLRLCSGETEPAEAADTFGILLRAHLERFTDQDSSTSNRSVLHRTRKIEKVTERLRILKQDHSKMRKSNPRQFFNALRAHNKCLFAKRLHDHKNDLRRQERAFRENPWSFAKRACKDISADVEPNFSAAEAYNHFENVTSGTNSAYNTPEKPGLPEWINAVMPAPDPDEMTPFDLSAITPGSIKRVLA